LDSVDHHPRYIGLLVAGVVEKGSADIYLMLRDQPIIDNPWANCLSSAMMDPETDLDVLEACQRAEKVWKYAEGWEDLEERSGIGEGRMVMERRVDEGPEDIHIG
jgi:hypothetical protein